MSLFTEIENFYAKLEEITKFLTFDIILWSFQLTAPENYVETETVQNISDPVLGQKIIEKAIMDPVIFFNSLIIMAEKPQYATLQKRVEENNARWISAKTLFSSSLPPEFNYVYENVVIKDGILLKGCINKSTLYSTKNGIIVQMYVNLGKEKTEQFIADLKLLLTHHNTYINSKLDLDGCIPIN